MRIIYRRVARLPPGLHTVAPWRNYFNSPRFPIFCLYKQRWMEVCNLWYIPRYVVYLYIVVYMYIYGIPRYIPWYVDFVCTAPRVPLRTPARRTLSASDRPPRSAPSPRLPLPGNKCAGASAREPGDGAGARRPGMALAPGRQAIFGMARAPGRGREGDAHFMAAPRSAQDLCVNRPRISLYNGFPLHGRLKTIRDRGG